MKALDSITPEEAWNGRRPCIAYLCIFGCVTYAMVPDEKKSKPDAKGTKYLFLDCCDVIKVYRLIYLQNKKIEK